MIREYTVASFFLSKYEITNRQYLVFCRELECRPPTDPQLPGMHNYIYRFPDHPVVNISWLEAKRYCDWAGLELPTEAQWEYAARGSQGLRYPWGGEAPDASGKFRANYSGFSKFELWQNWNSEGKVNWARDGFLFLASVGSLVDGTGPFGHLDQAGNVWEWCDTRYLQGSRSYVFKGGAFGSTAAILRPSYRNPHYPLEKAEYIGFRPSKKF